MGNISIFDLFLAGIGLYAVICGILGRGKLLQVDNVKEGCEEKLMRGQRIMYAVVGTFMFLNAVMSVLLSVLYERVAVENIYEFQPKFDLGAWSFLTPKFLTTMTFVFMFISLAVIVALIVFLKKMTNKPEKQKKGEKGAKPAQQSAFPDAAFDFGDEEPRPIRNKKK